VLPNLKQMITSAVLNRQRLLIRYGGRPQIRVVEPHILYCGANGAYVLLAYQIRGYSSRGREVPFWRPFQLAKIDRLAATDEVFEPQLSRDYATIVSLAKGQILCSIADAKSEYSYFNPALCGPPAPGDETHYWGVQPFAGSWN